MAKACLAPLMELPEGKTVGYPASDVGDRLAGRRRALELPAQHRDEIAWVQAVAYLKALTAEADVAKRAPLGARVNPEREHTLISSPELSGASEHTEAVDPHWKSERGAVFEGERL